jgi:ABC-type nitrate/sulfonate/bicarbonate transport system substrate-binding protein
MIQQYFATIFCFAAISLLYLYSVANAEEARVVAAYSSINPNSSQMEIARAQGFYRKYGLDPEIILVRSSATATAGLAAGNIQFGFLEARRF